MNILLLCTGNSCRSQMAHGFLEKNLKTNTNIFSAGIVAHGVNPKSIVVMNEIGIDISKFTSNVMNEYLDINFDYIFTLGTKAKKNCLLYPGNPYKVHKHFSDPFDAKGSPDEILDIYRKVRNEIEEFLKKFNWLKST